MYNYPKDLYVDVRIEEKYSAWMQMQNNEMRGDGDFQDIGAMVRVYDGEMWYTCSTNDLNSIQQEIDHLAAIAKPNPQILENETVKNFQVNKDEVLLYEGENDNRKLTRKDFKELLEHYKEACIDESISEMKMWQVGISNEHLKTRFYSSLGADISWDVQGTRMCVFYQLAYNDTVTWAGKWVCRKTWPELWGHEKYFTDNRDETLTFMKEAKNIEPGEYPCIFSPISNAMFTHESFGHKSESDAMLNDKTLQDEWIMGKKVGSDLISISDGGEELNSGYCPYDAEGTKAGKTWLIKDGLLEGRLHNAKSASILKEEVTGNARAQNYYYQPIVRMTNTYMEGGDTDPEEMIKGIEDGIFVKDVSNGTGLADFTITPTLCYRIRGGKICEPVRVNIIQGNVFQTLFDVDAVGNDFVAFEEFSCGKGGQWIPVGCGAPSIRIKKLKFS